MALIPLNTFKTKTAVLQSAWTTGTTATVYTAPIGVTSIILMMQVANVTTNTSFVSLAHSRNFPIFADAQGNGAQPAGILTELVKTYGVPSNDAASLTTGKLIVESLDSIICYSDTDNALKLTMSILETANA